MPHPTRPVWPLAPVLASFLLVACGEGGNYEAAPSGVEKLTTVDIGEEPPKETPESGEIPVSVPRIAYTYRYQYRLPAEHIAQVQARQASLCEKQGPQVCRVLSMQSDLGENDYASGSLTLAVAAPRARAFGQELAELVSGQGGDQIGSAIEGEDLSKQIVDTAARLKARRLLRDRLMEVLATRKGSVAELVEAERGVAKVNEEIDQAESWLAQMQGRVDFSEMNLSYAARTPSSGGFLGPIREAVRNLDTILGTVIGALIILGAIGIPLGLVIWGIVWLVSHLRRRRGS
ncbi:DUF4349 domain-containing protein [Novosphingobium decolorationis]|uniref:DUF4349 domain-containing protein n=1 Tax=Novosphingobium decolorationis TaxID=2698673 RepID=A0ABX8E1P4_9SPHN|nr:DUF4349 domain-containing protein [Novosphingobium decolorationis]QVM82874.1 DUF4349 domain-containing protein [Novosphingobium decolorationis]